MVPGGRFSAAFRGDGPPGRMLRISGIGASGGQTAGDTADTDAARQVGDHHGLVVAVQAWAIASDFIPPFTSKHRLVKGSPIWAEE